MQQFTCIACPRVSPSPSISLGHSASVFIIGMPLLACCAAAISSLNPSMSLDRRLCEQTPPARLEQGLGTADNAEFAVDRSKVHPPRCQAGVLRA